MSTYDFTKRFVTIIASKNMNDAIEFAKYIIELVSKLENVDIHILDADKSIANKKNNLQSAYTDFVEEVNKRVKERKGNRVLQIIIGIDKFLSSTEIDEFEFSETLKTAEESEMYNFIVIENPNRLKSHEYEGWYKNYITGEDGIWVGNGIDDQFLINIISDRMQLINNCGRSFGYLIEEGNAVLMKLIGMKEKGDENE